MSITLAAAVAFGATACATRSSNPASTSNASVAGTGRTAAATGATASTRADSLAIVAAANAFSAAYMRGDADSMAALYTEDAAIFPDGPPAIVGTEPIRRYWTLAPNRRITLHVLMTDRIEIVGDIAHDYGRFQIAGETDGTAWGPSFGKYLVVWHRGADGQWRMHLDMWNRATQPGG
jgi:ketosteroid isomerase-like protein